MMTDVTHQRVVIAKLSARYYYLGNACEIVCIGLLHSPHDKKKKTRTAYNENVKLEYINTHIS